MKDTRKGFTPQRIWQVSFGSSIHVFYTEYHAEQFARALKLNGTPYKMEVL